MRKILLVKPPFNGLTYPGSPKGPELLRAAVRANGIGVETMITDLQLSWQRKEDYLGQFAQTLEGWKPDLIGITNLSAQVDIANELAVISKDTLKGVVVVKGGYHESASADWTMRLHHDVVDFCIGSDGKTTTRVEGELAFIRIARLLEEGGKEHLLGNLHSIPGAVYMDMERKRIISNPPLDTPKNILDRVFASGLIHAPEYDFPIFDLLPTAHAELSRGCPNRCNYCAAAKTFGVRIRSVESIERQLKMLKKEGFRAFYADDSNFSVNRNWAKRVATSLYDIGFVWGANSRVELLDRETILHFGRTGCRYLFTGLESGVEAVLIGMNKVRDSMRAGAYLEKAQKVYAWLSEAKIPSAAFLMFGGVREESDCYSPETLEDVKASIRFAAGLKGLRYLSMNFLRILPGTRFAEDPAFSCIRPTGKKPLHGGYWDSRFYEISGEKDIRAKRKEKSGIFSCFELEDDMPLTTLAEPGYLAEILAFAKSEVDAQNRKRGQHETKLSIVGFKD